MTQPFALLLENLPSHRQHLRVPVGGGELASKEAGGGVLSMSRANARALVLAVAHTHEAEQSEFQGKTPMW